MNISAPFIKRPIGTSLLAIGLFVIGLMCYLRLGVAALPNIQIPVIFVHATQSGADASTMASTVTAPLERHLGQLPGIDRMRSSSSESSSMVFMIFQSNRDIDSAAQDVQTAINSAQSDLPSGLGTPMYQKANPNDDPVIAIALTSDTQSADELYNVADSLLAQRLRQITGISSVDIAGASTPAVRVDVDLRALNALGLTPDDLRNAVRAANVTSPTGFLSDGNTTMAIIANDSVAKAADFAQLAISTQSNGRIVRLGDVATATVPKLMLVSAPRNGGAITVRSFIPHRCHASIGVLGAVTVATACLLPGTPAHALAQLPGGTTQQLEIEHPSGASSCLIALDAHGNVVRAAVVRTARKLFDGVLFG